MTTHAPVLAAALNEAVRALASVSPTARLDADILMMRACGFTRTALVVRANEALTVAQYDEYRRLVDRRRAGEPIAYITGRCEFWSLPLTVTPAVLIPRPETELLVERALVRIPLDRDCTIADLGTGSGAIALAIASERPRAQIIATDNDADALGVARQNAAALRLTNIDFRLGDWFTPIAEESFDIMVSNPPYIRAGDPHLESGDVGHEPRAALIGGPDGLDAIRHIAGETPKRLRAGAWLLLEHGYDQVEAVAAILRASGFHDVRHYADLAGHPRVTEAAV